MAKILVVDDERSLLESLVDVIRYHGHDVTGVASGEAALQFLRDPGNPEPDLIVSDVLMPGVDGLQLFAAIKQEPKLSQKPVLFLSASIHDGVEKLIKDVPHVLFLQKPFDPDTLLEHIQQGINMPS